MCFPTATQGTPFGLTAAGSSSTPAASTTPPPAVPNEQQSIGSQSAGGLTPKPYQPSTPSSDASTRYDRSSDTPLKGGSGLNM